MEIGGLYILIAILYLDTERDWIGFKKSSGEATDLLFENLISLDRKFTSLPAASEFQSYVRPRDASTHAVN